MDSKSSTAREAQSDRVKAPHGAQPGFEQLFRHVAELREFASHFIAAKIDGIKASARLAVLYGALGLIGAVIGLTVVCTSAVLLCLGLAGGLGRLFNNAWLGNLVTGVAVLAMVVSVTWVLIGSLTKAAGIKTRSAYQTRAARQRAQFGEDVHERAHKTSV